MQNWWRLSWQKTFLVFVILISFIVTWIISMSLDGSTIYKPSHLFIQYFERDLHLPKPGQNGYKILYWTKFFRYPSGYESFYSSYSPCEWNCHFTTNRSKLDESHLLVFNARDLFDNHTDMPPTRKPHHIWMLHNTEPPWFTFLKLKDFNGVFNWTSFVRFDSDVPTFYGKAIPKYNIDKNKTTTSRTSGETMDLNIEQDQSIQPFKKRTKMVTWMASNCITKNSREFYVRELKRYLEVDRYGKCGELYCTKNKKKCAKNLQKYKYYLAFENANCRDYITEKLWYSLQLGIVPVVMGGSGSHHKVAPPNSFIDTANFKSVQELAVYLKMVASNQTEYEKYLAWRKSYSIGGNYLCELCRSLYKWDGRPQVYHNLYGWFRQDTCKPWSVSILFFFFFFMREILFYY